MPVSPCAHLLFPSSSQRNSSLLNLPSNLRTRVQLSSFLPVVIFFCAPAWGVTPESPEVRKLIDEGKAYLEQNTEEKLGGKCLIALVFLKEGAPLSHPRIQEALEACKAQSSQDILRASVYSNGLAIIFLAELEKGKNRDLIQRYATVMANRQKSHGGWGYESLIALATRRRPNTRR